MSCSCGGSGVEIGGSLFERPGLSFAPCACVLDRVAAQLELLSLRRRWDALLSDVAIQAAFEQIDGCGEVNKSGTTEPKNVRDGLRAAMTAALHMDDVDSTSFLDSVAQKRIADLEQRLHEMTIGRGRLATIVYRTGPHRHSKCCNPECRVNRCAGCYCCHAGSYALSSVDQDSMRAYQKEQDE